MPLMGTLDTLSGLPTMEMCGPTVARGDKAAQRLAKGSHSDTQPVA